MKLGPCIHLDDCSTTLPSILSLDLLFTAHCLLPSFCVSVILSETIMARAMNLRSCIHLDECSSELPSILSLDLLFTVHLLLSSVAFMSFSLKLSGLEP